MSPLAAITVFAPATVANLGPGYDILGLALDQPGDRVLAKRRDEPGAQLIRVEAFGDDSGSALPSDGRNTAVVAANRTLERLALPWGVELILEKGLPLGSGLGSSGASAVAAATAVNHLAGQPLRPEQLIGICAEAEAVACGHAHADNVAPGLLGGIVAVDEQQRALRIETPLSLWVVLISPDLELPTRAARAAVPGQIPIAASVANAAALVRIVYGLARGDTAMLEGAFVDRIVEPRRASMIPHFSALQAAAMAESALGASISGAGPSVFALSECPERAARIQRAMSQVWSDAEIPHRAWVSRINPDGAGPTALNSSGSYT